jgi:DNA repair protein RecN (Recombination protein N)
LELASKKQVFSVTHLAQCAAFADTHIKIYKEDSGGRTYTKAKILTPQEHIAEIARMISGEQISPSALAHAETLIASAKKR